MQSLRRLLIAIAACELVGIIGAVFTSSAIPTWYATLNKPFFSPPNWLFAPVWTTLYLLMGVAIYLILEQGWHKTQVRVATGYFLLQLALNAVWSPIFFGLRSPVIALVVIVAMLGMIVATMRKFYPLSRTAYYLLLPYLLWVSFATLLNAAIVWMN